MARRLAFDFFPQAHQLLSRLFGHARHSLATFLKISVNASFASARTRQDTHKEDWANFSSRTFA